MKDLIYYYLKSNTKNNQNRFELGEIQKGFNMSFVLDGTKDSAKIEVLSFNENEVEPNTIIKHEATNTFWVVQHDKVERFYHENNYFYKHHLQLVGAIDLLNSRDLTDCGFRDKKYTIKSFINRLFKLSTFEFYGSVVIVNNANLDLDQVVDYVKTFQNYTLSSSIREFFDGYNCVAKLRFGETRFGDTISLRNAFLTIDIKTGNPLATPISENVFSDVRETRTMDKNSFGTTVISNAENVISTKAKTYPSVGWARLSGSTRNITPSTAKLFLPSNIYKVNWIKCIQGAMRIKIHLNQSNPAESDDRYVNFILTNDYKMNETYNTVIQIITNYFSSATDQTLEEITDWLENNRDYIFSIIRKGGTFTFPTDYYIEPLNGYRQLKDSVADYFPRIVQYGNNAWAGYLAIGEKDERNYIDRADANLTYEKGSNYIGGFDFLSGHIGDYVSTEPKRTHKSSYLYTDLRNGSYDYSSHSIVEQTFPDSNVGACRIYFYLENVDGTTSSESETTMFNFNVANTYWKVNYIPMSDIKIKIDNDADRLDTQLYNQNGKLNDSVALSKLMLSYSKEIQSDTITKYANFYSFDSVLKVGDTVSISNQTYVINNVSLDFTQNEEVENDIGYFISGEFTMSKQIATKSLMTNPNQNIRDYGIPQKNNVERKQLYRDFYEFDNVSDNLADTNYYLTLDQVFNFTTSPKSYSEHTAVIKTTFSNPISGSKDWYYQLDTTTYVLKKSLYEVVRFPDNNIIGYDAQNVYTGFNITRILNGSTDAITTPISYVDNEGEIEGIYLAFVDRNNLGDIYNAYQVEHNTNRSLINYSVFIDREIYEGISNSQNYEDFAERQYERTIENNRDRLIPIPTFEIDLTDYLPTDFDDDISTISPIITSIVDNEERSYNVLNAEINENRVLQLNISGVIPANTTLTFYVKLFIRHATPLGAKYNSDFIIKEPNYEKDAIEVPVFEYSCQIDDSDSVIVGDNILEVEDTDQYYMYSFYLVDKNKYNSYNWSKIETNYIHLENNQPYIDIADIGANTDGGGCVKMTYVDNELKIQFYQKCVLRSNGNMDYMASIDVEDLFYEYRRTYSDSDIVIVRHRMRATDEILVDGDESKKDLIFILKDIEHANIDEDTISLKVNHYRLK